MWKEKEEFNGEEEAILKIDGHTAAGRSCNVQDLTPRSGKLRCALQIMMMMPTTTTTTKAEDTA